MHGLLRTSGHGWVRDRAEVHEFVELEAAALPCRPYASLDAQGHPCNRMTKEVGPWVRGSDVQRFHRRHIGREAPVPPFLEEGCHCHYDLH